MKRANCKQEVEIYRLAKALLKVINPEYARNDDFVLQAHAMHSGCAIAKHKDLHDVTFQLGMTFGNYEGGKLVTWNSNDEMQDPINVKDKVVKLDGRLAHGEQDQKWRQTQFALLQTMR